MSRCTPVADALGSTAAPPRSQYLHAIRKRDGAACVVWVYEQAGETKVACARTHGPVTVEDFLLIATVRCDSLALPKHLDGIYETD